MGFERWSAERATARLCLVSPEGKVKYPLQVNRQTVIRHDGIHDGAHTMKAHDLLMVVHELDPLCGPLVALGKTAFKSDVLIKRSVLN